MKRLLLALAVLALAGLGLWFALRPAVADTGTAALKAFPIYSFARLRNETLIRARHAGVAASNRLFHRPTLSGPRDRVVTTPNNDTLYSSAFLDLAAGPVLLAVPALPDRYHSAALMDARTDNVVIAGTRDGGGAQTLLIAGPAFAGAVPAGVRLARMTTNEAWLLVRVLVDGPTDLPAARAAQQGFVLTLPDASRRADRQAVVLPVLPDPATLLRRANPPIAENAHLQDPALAATGFGGSAQVFDDLAFWRQWLWRLLLPQLFDRLKGGITAGSTATGDGWSKSPPGIGTAEASDRVRAGVALGGLGALPASEAVYWSATVDGDGADLVGTRRYRLVVPPAVPARAFWSISMYERLPDGRLFYVENPIRRYAIGNRTPGLTRTEAGSLVIDMGPADPGPDTNWLPTPPGPFTLIFRAYLPGPHILDGRWRLPPVERLP
jgi:hypothetical protein